jgi:hypothetical protein
MPDRIETGRPEPRTASRRLFRVRAHWTLSDGTRLSVADDIEAADASDLLECARTGDVLGGRSFIGVELSIELAPGSAGDGAP